MRYVILSVLLFSVLTASAYGAEPDAFYLGVSTGETQWAGGEPSTFGNPLEDPQDSIFAPSQTFTGTTNSSQISIGYQINRALGFELRYTDYGVVQQAFAIKEGIVFIMAPLNAQSIEAEAFTLLAKFGHRFPLGIKLFAEAGITQARFDSTVFTQYGDRPRSGSLIPFHNYSQQGTTWGAGAGYALTGNIAAQLQWQRQDYDGMEMQTSTLSIQFGF